MMGMLGIQPTQGIKARTVALQVTETTPTALRKFPYSKAYLTGKEAEYVNACLANGRLSGNGTYTQRCEQFFRDRFGFHAALMTPSCTDALEMAALLLDLTPGDEVIMPSFTFVSTASAFALRGAKIIFADSDLLTGNIDVAALSSLITPKTKAIVVVHYAGVACDMTALAALVKQHQLYLVEDCAHAIDATYDEQPLGSFGDLATFSFHETKNIICGEGGMLVINNPAMLAPAEIIREKGTDRQAFLRGEVDKYTWRSLGSSFLAPDYAAAFLLAQLENLDYIQSSRLAIWNQYQARLTTWTASTGATENAVIQLPTIPDGVEHNAHIFYFLTQNNDVRNDMLAHLKKAGIQATSHYLPLEQSPFYHEFHDGRPLPVSQRWSDTIVRLPLYVGLSSEDVDFICDQVIGFFE